MFFFAIFLSCFNSTKKLKFTLHLRSVSFSEADLFRKFKDLSLRKSASAGGWNSNVCSDSVAGRPFGSVRIMREIKQWSCKKKKRLCLI